MLLNWRALLLLCAAPSAGYALDALESPSDYITSRWDTEDGLPQNLARNILQTRDGYLWLGTGQGLARFDGLAFTTFKRRQTPGFEGTVVTALAEDRRGDLWIGTSTGLVRYTDGRFRTYTAADGLKADTISALCIATDGSLWVGTSAGIVRRVGDRFVNDLDTHGLPLQGLRAMSVDREGRIWIAAGTHAVRFAQGKFTAFGAADGLPAQGVQAVREDPDGRTLVATQSGLFILDGERFVPASFATSNPRINVTLVDRDGNLWVGSATGLDRIAHGKTAPYAAANGEAMGGVDGLFEDREGNLWVGSSAGLYRFNNRRGVTWWKDRGVLGTLVLALAESRDRSLWVSSWSGGVARFKDGAVTQYRLGAPLSNENVTSIYEAPDGTLWFGNRGSAVDRLDGDRVTTYVYASGVATSRYVTAMHAEPGGELLVAIAGRGLFHIEKGALVPMANTPDFSGQNIWAIHRTRDGTLLLGTTAGLFERKTEGGWARVTLPNLESLSVRTLFEDERGTIWLGTAGDGLVRWEGKIARSYSLAEGMFDDSVSGIVDDGAGSLWVTTARTICRIRRAELDALDRGAISQLNPLAIGRADGLLSGATPSNSGGPVAVRRSDGTLLFATVKGLAAISPLNLKVNPIPPNVVIERVRIDDRPVSRDRLDAIKVPAGSNRIEIRYTGLSLAAPEQLRFRYRLEGSDATWVEAGHARSATYTHLAPGAFKFTVLACNNDGVWAEHGPSLAIVVLPHWYQTMLFKLTSALAVCLGLGALVGFRIRRLKQRAAALVRANAELDQRVRERTAELAQREILFRLIFEHAPVGISWSRADLGPEHHFNSTFTRLLGLPSATSPDSRVLIELTHPEDRERQEACEAQLRSGAADSYTLEQRFIRRDGQEVHALLAAAVVRAPDGRPLQHIRIVEDVSELKRAQTELVAAHRRLVEAARLAGMAEIATGVLHNVGNVLNSINVSASLLADGLRKSRVDGLGKITALLHANAQDIARYLHEDPKGQNVLPYLDSLAGHLTSERQRLLAETEVLRKSVEHIKAIVARQQEFARYSGISEVIAAAELVEDAVEMTSLAMARHGVEVVKEFAAVPPVAVERHKVLQILTNLLQNAKQAVDRRSAGEKRVTLRISRRGDFVRIEVEDNGVGIPPENLTRIFELGFTTRAEGHGFGLHSSANAAREMHGALSAESAGLDRGAVFILDLPVAAAPPHVPPAVANASES